MGEPFEDRLERIEHEIDDIRHAVTQNTKNIAKLSSDVARLESKVDTLVSAIQNNNNIIMSFFNQYKGIIDKLLKGQQEDSKAKWSTLNRTIDILAKVSLIALVAVLGFKGAGLI